MLYGWKFDFGHFELDKMSKLICCNAKLFHNSLLLNNIGIGRTPLFTNSIGIEIAFYLHTLRKLLLMDDGRVYDQNQQCYHNFFGL